jgi:predicted transcriptional regulator
MEKIHTSPDLLEQVVALVREHGPLTEREIAMRLGVDLHRVEVTVDQATQLLRRPSGAIAHLVDVLESVAFTHRVRGPLAGRTDLWLGLGVQPFTDLADDGPVPLASGGEATLGADLQGVLVGPEGWLPDVPRHGLVALTWRNGALEVAAVDPDELPSPEEEQHVRRMVAEYVDRERWWSDPQAPEDRARAVLRAVAYARLEDPEFLSTAHLPLDEVLIDPFEVKAAHHWREYAASKQQESVSFCLGAMPVALHSELSRRATQYGMAFDQFVIAILGHLAWRTPFAEDIEPWDQWLPDGPHLHRSDADMIRRMRTTVDLPPAVHRRATELARERHQSLSAVVADLTIRGLAALGEPVKVSTDPISGLPAITLGHRVTSADVADALDDE